VFVIPNIGMVLWYLNQPQPYNSPLRQARQPLFDIVDDNTSHAVFQDFSHCASPECDDRSSIIRGEAAKQLQAFCFSTGVSVPLLLRPQFLPSVRLGRQPYTTGWCLAPSG
jgi:hypothetical protein